MAYMQCGSRHTIGTTAVLLSCISAASAWKSEGQLPTSSSFATYVGKFCFDYVPLDFKVPATSSRAGRFEFVVQGEVANPVAQANKTDGQLHFAVFDDEKHHWQRVRPFWDELSCKERLELASWSTPLSAKLSATPHLFKRTIHVNQAIRPRFWYFAFVNCGAEIIQPVSYAVHALNIHQGFEAEFGMDAQGSIALETIFVFLFMLILLIICFAACSRTARLQEGSRGMSSLLRLLAMSIACSAAGCGFRAVHHAVFAVDGKGVLFAAVLGTTSACAAKALLAILQLLIAKGWALFSTPDERPQRHALFCVLTAVILLSVGCEIWEQYFHDQSTTFYLYESWPGRIMLVLNLCVLVASSRFMWKTYHLESVADVRWFYTVVSAACGIYFVSLPVVCLLAELLNPWVRRNYVERVELLSRFAVTLLLVICLWPSRVDTLVAARLKNRDQPKLLGSDAQMEAGEVNEDRA